MPYLELEVERLYDLVEGVSRYDALTNKFFYTPEWIAEELVVITDTDDVMWKTNFAAKNGKVIWHANNIYAFVLRKLKKNKVHIAIKGTEKVTIDDDCM